MYYFKDHLNFSNNLQDNLYILRQIQLKEAAWSPSSGGIAIPDSKAGTDELASQMRNIKQSGDRPQSAAYKEMEAEYNRRTGVSSNGIPQSADVKTDKVAGDWVERYARKLDMDPRKVENIRRGVIDMDTSGRGEDPISQTQDQVAQRGVEAYDRAKQFVVDLQKKDADKKASSVASTPASAPTTYRGFDRGDGLAKPEVTAPATPQRDINISGQGSIPNNSGGMQNADQTPGTARSYNPGYGRQDIGRNAPGRIKDLPSTQEDAIRIGEIAQFNVPGGVTIPATAPAAPQSSPSNAANPILDQLRKTWKDLGTPRYSPKPESVSPGVDATEPQSFGTNGADMAPGQPYVVPGSQNWNNLSHDEQEQMVSRAIFNNETNKFTGGRRSDVKDIDQVSQPRFSEDSGEGGPSAADINQRSRIANAVIDKANKEAQDEASSKFNKSAGVAENDPNYIYSRKNFAQSLYSPEEPKPAEDTRPTSGRKTLYPGALEDIIDRMQNNDRSKKISSTLKDLRARRNFNRKAR